MHLEKCQITALRSRVKLFSDPHHRAADSQAKVRRSKRLAATRKGTSGQTGPIRCHRMRTRHDPLSNGNPWKRRRAWASKTDGACQRPQKVRSCLLQLNQCSVPKKKMRDEVKVPVLDKTCSWREVRSNFTVRKRQFKRGWRTKDWNEETELDCQHLNLRFICSF